MKKYCITVLCYLLFVHDVSAQLCTGSLGDPVVHITFGNAFTERGPLSANITSMSYVETCPNDGFYTITGSSGSCFNNTWFDFSQDHTGDAGGRVMLINASFSPSTFYVDTVRGLCGNTVYEFATWAANVIKSTACNGNTIPPNLSFSIETTNGVQLQQINSGDIGATPGIIWKQYGIFFTTPANTGEVVLRIRNNSVGGCGNDLMLDDITFRPCGPKIDAYADNNAGDMITVCGDKQTDIGFTASYSTGFVDPLLQWQVSRDSGRTWTDIPGEQGIRYIRKPSASGYYQYRAAISERINAGSARCRIASNVTTIHVPTPPLTSTKMITGCLGATAKLEEVSGAGYSYQWSGPGGFSSTASSVNFPAVAYADSGLYRVAISVLSCTAEDSFYLRVFPNAVAGVSAGGSLCEGTGMVLTASGGVQYTWSPAAGVSNTGSANPFISPADTTRYKVIVTNQYGCRDSAFATVNVWKKPVANAGSDQQIFSGDTTRLNGMVAGTSVSYNWSPAVAMQNSNSLTTVVNPEENTTYTLTAVSQLGCGTATDDVLIKVYKAIRPPNAFSPNGDGINDNWIIPGLETYPESIVSVYSRTGQLLFRTRSTDKNWDGLYEGKQVPVGTYYYLIDLNIARPLVAGWVLVIR